MTQASSALPEGQKCYFHPTQPALLRCSKCERPICQKDMISTPVGYRCFECALGPKNNMTLLRPDASTYPRALAAALAMGLACGILWGVFPFFAFWLSMLMGFGVTEVITRNTRARRGPPLIYMGLASMLAGLVLAFFLMGKVPEFVSLHTAAGHYIQIYLSSYGQGAASFDLINPFSLGFMKTDEYGNNFGGLISTVAVDIFTCGLPFFLAVTRFRD